MRETHRSNTVAMKYLKLLEVLETEGEPIVSQKCFVLGETSLHFVAQKRCVFKRSHLRSCEVEAVRTPIRLTLAQFRLPGIRLRRRLQRLAQPSAWRSLLSVLYSPFSQPFAMPRNNGTKMRINNRANAKNSMRLERMHYNIARQSKLGFSIMPYFI